MFEVITICVVVLWFFLAHAEKLAGKRPLGRWAWLARFLASMLSAFFTGALAVAYYSSAPPAWLPFAFVSCVCIYMLAWAVHSLVFRRRIEQLLAQGKLKSMFED